jgi:3-hydroxybutyryl-CoA dehydrogenase
MHILAIGEEFNLNECRQKFGAGHDYAFRENFAEAQDLRDQVDVIFDFINYQHTSRWTHEGQLFAPLFLNTTKVSLSQLQQQHPSVFNGNQFGFAGMPTFLNREILEASLLLQGHRGKLTELCERLNTPFQVVEDRVGLVTPRVICMIINEAYYTVEEGTATRSDVDLAMKSGTNYPFGPFEWCQKIGIREVFELLEAVHADTKNERYKICPLLRAEYSEAIG